jgi:hypothetical protein
MPAPKISGPSVTISRFALPMASHVEQAFLSVDIAMVSHNVVLSSIANAPMAHGQYYFTK